jgi:hypothetical protein
VQLAFRFPGAKDRGASLTAYLTVDTREFPLTLTAPAERPISKALLPRLAPVSAFDI